MAYGDYPARREGARSLWPSEVRDGPPPEPQRWGPGHGLGGAFGVPASGRACGRPLAGRGQSRIAPARLTSKRRGSAPSRLSSSCRHPAVGGGRGVGWNGGGAARRQRWGGRERRPQSRPRVRADSAARTRNARETARGRAFGRWPITSGRTASPMRVCARLSEPARARCRGSSTDGGRWGWIPPARRRWAADPDRRECSDSRGKIPAPPYGHTARRSGWFSD
jgi:hypothetical protein